MPVVFHQAFSPGAGRIWGETAVRQPKQKQSDWNVTDDKDVSYILNKPPPALPPLPQQQSDWLLSDTTKPAYIKNKPTIISGDALQYIIGPQGPMGPGALQPQLITEATLLALFDALTEFVIITVAAVVKDAFERMQAELQRQDEMEQPDGPLIGGPGGGGGGDGDDDDGADFLDVLKKAAIGAAIAAALAGVGAAVAKALAGGTVKDALAGALSGVLSSLIGSQLSNLLTKMLDLNQDKEEEVTKYAVPDWRVDDATAKGYIQHKPAITSDGSFPAGGSTGLPFDFSNSGITQLTDILYIPSLDAETGLGCGLIFGSDVSASFRDKDAGKHFYLDGCVYATGGGKLGSEDPVEFPEINNGYEYALADNVRVTKSLTCPTIQAELNLYTKKVTATDVLVIGDPSLAGRQSKAGTATYAVDSFGVDVYGAGSQAGQLQLNLHDNVGVSGDLVVEGNLIVKGNATISGISAGAGWTTLTGGFKMQFGQFTYKPVYNAVLPNKYIYVNFPTPFKTGCFSLQVTPGSDTRNPESPVLAVDSLNLLTGTIMYTPTSGKDAAYDMTGYYIAIGI